MARSSSPNSANSQFFICFSFISRQAVYGLGQVIDGMEHVDKIKKGSSINNGSVSDPDHMVKLVLESHRILLPIQNLRKR